jgi:hypothetical protein
LSPPGHKKNRVIQIDVTSRCDLRCSNCTRHLAHVDRYDMSPAVFRETCRILNRALPTFIIGMFGGNPMLHPQAEQLMEIMQEEIPEAWRRGLWCNHLRGHGAAAARCFAGGYLNLNAHNVPEAAAEFDQWFPGRMINESRPHADGGRSARHAALLTAIQDFVGTAEIPDANAMWKRIAACDYDREWSGCVIELGGKPLLYSCEIQSAFDLMYRNQAGFVPVGVELSDESAIAGINTFAHQYFKWCPRCGAGLKLAGQLDCADTYDVSKTHLPLVQLRVKRKTVLHESLAGAARCELSTDYERRRTAEEVIG